MDLKLKGKVIVVTGGAKGIGAAIVRGCAAEGAIPVIIDRDREAAALLQAALQRRRRERSDRRGDCRAGSLRPRGRTDAWKIRPD